MPLVLVQPKSKYTVESSPVPILALRPRSSLDNDLAVQRDFLVDTDGEAATTTFKHKARRYVLVLVAVVRLLTGVQLIVFGLMHCFVSQRQVHLMQMWTANYVVGFVYICVGVVMLALTLPMFIKPRRRRKQKAIESNKRPTKRRLWWLSTFSARVPSSRVYRWCTSHDSSLVLLQGLAILAQLSQAYTMSSLVLKSDFVVIFAVLIGLGAIAAPFCLCLPLLAMRTTGVLIVNLFVTFMLSIVIPLCIVLPALVKYLASGVDGLMFTNDEFVVSVFSVRQASVKSFGDLIVKLCPIVAMSQTMRNLTLGFQPSHNPRHLQLVKKRPTMSTISEIGEPSSSSLLATQETISKHLTQSNTSQRSSAAIQVSFGRAPLSLQSPIPSPVPFPPPARHVPKRVQKKSSVCSIVDGAPRTFANKAFVRVFVSCHVISGLIVIGLAMYSYVKRASCPSYCAQHVAPWLTPTCECIYVNLKCQDLNITGTTEEMQLMLSVEAIGKSVFWLQIVRCEVADGLSPATMLQLPALYGISMWHTQLTAWTMPKPVWPKELTKISLQHSPQLTTVPDVLSHLPSLVQVLFLVGCGITNLPNTTVQSWKNLRQLWISQLPLTSLPPSISSLESLNGLRLNNNRLLSFSTDMFRPMAALELLSLSSNHLTLVPWDRRAILTDVTNNPIATMPRGVSVDLLASGVVMVADTPFCATQVKQNPAKWRSICHSLCAPQCSRHLVGNGLCDVSCLVPQCDYDGGDCAEFFIPGAGSSGIQLDSQDPFISD